MRWWALIALASLQACAKPDPLETRLNLVTCAPDTFMSKWSEKLDAKAFWVRETVALGMILERGWEFEDAIQQCREIPVGPDRQQCLAHVHGHRSSMGRCLQHSRRMCRQYGAC